LHLLRSGLDVARSIQQRVEAGGPWYGLNDSKWRLLQDYARRHGVGELTEKAGGNARLRGLVEWRLAVTHVRDRMRDGDLEVRYEDLIARPQQEVDRILGWIGASPGLDATSLARQSAPAKAIDPDAELIAGDLLRKLNYPN
jgi:hypothetical protein